MSSVIELELLREQQYKKVYEAFTTALPAKTPKKLVSHMLLRFIFNLRATPEDDPVFVAEITPEAEAQIRKDIQYSKLGDAKKEEEVLDALAIAFDDASLFMTDAIVTVPADGKVTLDGGYLLYKNLKFRDVHKLGIINPSHAVALHIRYSYLDLGNHGLARLYKGSKDGVTEGFANSFNHYYNSYCSLFPDLETVFGSKGSFFSQSSFTTPIVQLNPPFDESVIAAMAEKVYTLLSEGAKNTFIITVPDWPDFDALALLENSKWTKSITAFEKGELAFVDHMTGKKIFPCGIVELTLSN